MPFNREIFLQIYSLSNHNILLDKLMIFLANDLIWITAFLIIFLAFVGKLKEKKAFLLSVLGVIFAAILIFLIRLFFFEPRPFVTLSLTPLVDESAGSAAFPSFHTTLMAIPAFVFLFVKSKWAPIFVIFLILVAFARIYVGAHYPFDILGGLLVGFLSVFLSSKLLNKFLNL